MTTSTVTHTCTPPLLVTIKGGGRTLSRAGWLSRAHYDRTDSQNTLTLVSSDIGTHLNHSTASRDLGAFLPLSPRLYPLLQALPVQNSTVLSHALLLDVRPRGRNQDKPVSDCVASCINHLGRGTCSIITSRVWTTESGHRHFFILHKKKTCGH